MVEAALNAAADQVVERSAYGRLIARAGNRGPVAAPQNIYPCRGTERWIALAVVTDAQWAALVDLLGRPAWTAEPTLERAEGRRARHDLIDGELTRWFAEQALDAAVARLVARGVPAAPVVSPREVDQNPQLRARGFFETVTHPVVGAHDYPGLPMRFSAGPERWFRAPAPMLGQHNEEILRGLLGLDEAEIAALRADGIIGDRPVGL